MSEAKNVLGGKFRLSIAISILLVYTLPVIGNDESVCTSPYMGVKDIVNITDSNHPLVVESKQVILSLGISEDYFNKYFRFLCAADSSSRSYRAIRWQYKIGEFSIILEDTLGFSGSDNIHGIQNLGKLNEVQSVISKHEAEEKMQSCIGDFQEARLEVGMPRVDTYPRVSRPYFIARSIYENHEERGLDIKWDVGYVDLETGECTKSQGRIVHRPGSLNR